MDKSYVQGMWEDSIANSVTGGAIAGLPPDEPPVPGPEPPPLLPCIGVVGGEFPVCPDLQDPPPAPAPEPPFPAGLLALLCPDPPPPPADVIVEILKGYLDLH